MTAYWIHDWSPFLFRIGEGFGLRWYGLAYVLAFGAGYWVCRDLARRGIGPLRPEQVGDFITWAALFGVILGGRLGYLLLYTPRDFFSDPFLFLRFWEGGMASHGGILGLLIFTWFYSRKHGIPWRALGDNLVVAAPPGIFFGRVANFINGELYGRPATVPWAVQFPKELYDMPYPQAREALDRLVADAPGVGTLADAVGKIPYPDEVREVFAEVLTPRHPSQLYAAALEGLLLFGVLWWLRTRKRTLDGVLTGVFFAGYGVVRITGEFFREPDAGLILGLPRGQFFSIFLLGIGAVFLLAARANQKTRGT